MDVDEAKRLGIVMQVVTGELLERTALELAARYHDASTEALGIAKNILNRSFELDYETLAEMEANAQALSLHTQYHDEAVANFLDKRPLRFRGVQR